MITYAIASFCCALVGHLKFQMGKVLMPRNLALETRHTSAQSASGVRLCLCSCAIPRKRITIGNLVNRFYFRQRNSSTPFHYLSKGQRLPWWWSPYCHQGLHHQQPSLTPLTLRSSCSNRRLKSSNHSMYWLRSSHFNL